MNLDPKLLEIFSITVPVFALAGFGKFLSYKKVLTNENRQPLSWITYYLALPALIFSSFLKKGSFEIPISALLLLSLLPILVTSLWVFFSLKLTKSKSSTEKKYASIYTSYWGNNGYMGIPLAISAIANNQGLPLAAIINGLSVPFYIAISLFMMYKAKGNGDNSEKIKAEFLHTLFSPVILAMIFGAIISYFKPAVPDYITSNQIVSTIYHTGLEIISQLGHMGLPLALLLIGSNLSIRELKTDKLLLGLSVFGKLIVAPATVFFLAYRIFPNLPKESFQALVLLNAVPGAVASFIISEKFNCAEDFVSSSLVISTLLSIITIPLWLSIILV